MICLATLLIAYSSNWMKDLDRGSGPGSARLELVMRK